MTKKRLLLFASVPLTIAVIVGLLAVLPPRPGVTKANFDRIRDGMPLVEVERVFGRKARTFDEMKVERLWRADDGSVVTIRFDKDDRVADTYWQDSNETIFGRIFRLLP